MTVSELIDRLGNCQKISFYKDKEYKFVVIELEDFSCKKEYIRKEHRIPHEVLHLYKNGDDEIIQKRLDSLFEEFDSFVDSINN